MAIPASIQAYNKYGAHRSNIHYITYNHFTLPSEFLDCFAYKKLLILDVKTFLSQCRDGLFQDGPGGNRYPIVFHNTSRGKLMNLSEGCEVAVSIRQPQPEFNIEAIALIIRRD